MTDKQKLIAEIAKISDRVSKLEIKINRLRRRLETVEMDSRVHERDIKELKHENKPR